jgi:hypothetical protein
MRLSKTWSGAYRRLDERTWQPLDLDLVLLLRRIRLDGFRGLALRLSGAIKADAFAEHAALDGSITLSSQGLGCQARFASDAGQPCEIAVRSQLATPGTVAGLFTLRGAIRILEAKQGRLTGIGSGSCHPGGVWALARVRLDLRRDLLGLSGREEP